MTALTYLQAISSALRDELRTDDRVLVMGEDIGVFGGAFKVTDGFIEEFGPDRVMDTPLAESAIVGCAVGAAVVGMRPVCEMQFADFISCGFDQLVNVAGKMHYRQGLAVPITVRLPSGGGFSGGPFHSQNPEAWFMQAPGIKVVAPSTAEDAKGLLHAAIHDPNPVCFMEHKHLYRRVRGEVPDGVYETPFEARVARPGSDLVVIAYGAMVHVALEATEDLDGASVEVLDLRSLVPLDEAAILDSVERCSKVVIVDEANSTCAAGAQVVAVIAENGFESLDGPVVRVATPDVPIPFSPPLEQAVLPSVERVREACRELLASETVVDVTMPQMGVSVAEGTVVEWRVGVGDSIAADQTICEISTDKIDTEVPAPVGGVVTEILVQVEETVPVGEVLARIAVEGDGGAGAASAGPAPTAPHDAPESGAPSNGAGTNGASTRVPAGTSRPPGGRRYSPVVGRIAAQHGIDLSEVPGTGRGGRVRKQDVLAFIEAGPGAAPPVAEVPVGEAQVAAASVAEAPLHIESPYRPEPAAEASPTLSRMRRQIGEHMKRSLETAATCTTWIEVDMSRVERARARLGVTALAFVARATIEALREHPALNAWLEEERYTAHSAVNLGIAVSLGEDGLIVPVVHDAHELSAEGLAARIKELARRARSRELTPDDVRGGTFTITNPGQYGSIMATPIINQPQVAILDFETVVKRPVVITDSDGNDSIAIRPITILGLSWDHRALDGVLAAQFLAAVKTHLEGPGAS